MQTTDTTLVLDRRQLRDMTMDDEEMMREILAALIEDTGSQLSQIDSAIRERNAEQCKRLAHYCKGACANVGANAAAGVLRRMEQEAVSGEFDACARSLAALADELNRLKEESEKEGGL